jgi:type IV secretory pathway VirB10-like protein
VKRASTETAKSLVFERPHLPRVAQRNSPLNLGIGIAGACGLGLITFFSMSGGQSAHSTPATKSKPVRLAQAAAMPQMAPPPPAPVFTGRNTAPADPPNPPLRWRAPAMIVDFSASATAASGATIASGPTPDYAKLSAEERFSARVSNSQVETARATHLRDLSYVAPQGTIIPAVLETAINSDLPGFARAVISRDVHGFDGTRVLIPRGSKLIGQYRSGVAQGQSRAFVVWSRILTPDGVSIDVGSPSTDELGRGGLEGETDSHFFQRFGSAILLSVMSAGLTALANGASDNNTVVVTSPDQTNQVAGIALQKQIDIPVTVRVPQGTPLQVFVTRDLDFSGQTPVTLAPVASAGAPSTAPAQAFAATARPIAPKP